VLAHGLGEPSRSWDTLHAAGSVGRTVEVPGWLDEGVELRAARRLAAVGQEGRSSGGIGLPSSLT